MTTFLLVANLCVFVPLMVLWRRQNRAIARRTDAYWRLIRLLHMTPSMNGLTMVPCACARLLLVGGVQVRDYRAVHEVARCQPLREVVPDPRDSGWPR